MTRTSLADDAADRDVGTALPLHHYLQERITMHTPALAHRLGAEALGTF